MAKAAKVKIKGKLSKEALEVLALPKDTLASPGHSSKVPGWTVQDIRKTLLEAIIKDSVGDMLQKARQAQRVTGEHLGKRLGVSKARVAQLESLQGGQVELQTLAHYAHALGYKVNIHFVPEDKDGQIFSAVL